jgi:alanine racemase
MYTLKDIAQFVDAKTQGSLDIEINFLATDSRLITDTKHTVFIALQTDKNDGHQYIKDAYNKGIRCFLVQHIPESYSIQNDLSFLVVKNTMDALHNLAKHHRLQFNAIPIIGITGSNGKTIVKEWLYQLLKNDYNISRSPKSYNSQIGVPLSVWQLNNKHSLGIFEAGISKHNEMILLEDIIKPTIGILTSIGSAHDEGFVNSIQKLNEKLKLFCNCETVIVNALSLSAEQKECLAYKKFLLISNEPNSFLQIIQIKTLGIHTYVKAKWQEKIIDITIPFSDSASVENAITCWATLLFLNIEPDEIAKRTLTLQPVAMRLELKLGTNNCILINDFYNSDINALEIALHHQNQQNRGGKKIVILSDIEQTGKTNEELYEIVSKLIHQFKVDVFVGIGHEIAQHKNLFNCESFFFETTDKFIAEQKKNFDLHFSNSIILLKGARRFEFENISKLFQQKSHDTVLEINLNKLIQNINFYRSQIQKSTKLMCMVKATGYGSGSAEIAFTLQHHQVDYLAVAYADEGVELRKAGIHLPIMVMNPEESSYQDMIDFRLEPELFSFKVAKEFIQALQINAFSEPFPVHLKIDTGMHRLGFEEHEIDVLCSFIKSETSIQIKSIFSHLVASDNQDFDDFTNKQIESFEYITNQIESAIGYSCIKHICNSGAITRFKNAHYNMVRLGIGMYGIGFNDFEKKNLENISVLKTKISQIKTVKAGDTVGYNRSGKIDSTKRIATIPIGYADGFSRRLGNGNFEVIIKEKSCKTIGNICMDMCMVDVSLVDCIEGDEVIVFETNEQILKLSKAMDTIPYEVLTGISSRVKRVYVQE